MSVHIRGIGPDGQWITKAERNDMSLSTATTDAAVIDALSLRVQARASAGVYGADRRGTLRERRTRKRVERAFWDCCEWYRYEGAAALGKRSAYGSDELFRADLEARVRLMVGGYRLRGVSAGLLSWLAWLGFSWLLEIIVREFVEWLLSSESQAWREAA